VTPLRLLWLPIALVALGFVLGTDSPSARAVADGVAVCAPPEVQPGGVGEGRNDPLLFPPTVGELDVAMLFVDFADARATQDARAAYEAFVPGAVDWYRMVSYDRLRLVVTPLLRRIALRHTVRHYLSGGGAGIETGLRAAFEEAVAAADPELDFSRFRAVYVVLPWAALGAIGGSGVLILERPVHVDGTDIRTFAVLYDGDGAQPMFLAHETGHVLGLPDLYSLGRPDTFHRWDIMASPRSPRGLFAWHLWKLGWLDPAQIVCFTSGRRIEATLTPLERSGGTKAIILRRGRYAYVAEVRDPVASDYGGKCKGGVLFYRVEFGAPSGEADIVLLRARYERDRVRCGIGAAAPFRRGRGEVSSVRAWGLRFEVRAALADGAFRVRVTKLR
jgi:M6 family metalloprotease-like protein